MARKRSKPDTPTPALYAMVQPGLELIAADEITRDLGGDVKKTSRGIVVFKLNAITADVLKLRTTEDVFVLAWGSDSLTYKSDDLDNLRKWTAKPDWPSLFKIHHGIRPKPKGRPTFHLVCQMQGEHGFKRYDARDALLSGVSGKIPDGWRVANENAWLEIWLTIRGQTAVCGVRLSDRTMRHRTYKDDHILASLRPTVAAAMVRLAGIGPGMTVIDPMCGAGTILAETIEVAKLRTGGRPPAGRPSAVEWGERVTVLGGDNDANAVFVSSQNLDKVGPVGLARWDTRRLPLATASVDRIVSNPPFGKQLESLDLIPPLYAAAAAEWDRVLRPGGRGVFLVMEQDALRVPLRAYRWKPLRQLRVRVQGQAAVLSVWQKPSN